MKFDNPYSIFLNDSPLELVFPSNNSYKGSSTKSKAIAKRRKRNKNKKTHRNAKR